MQLRLAVILLLACLAQARGSAGSDQSAALPFQLDVCGRHKAVPGTTLSVTKDGVCVLASQVLTTCTPTGPSAALVMRFPCTEGPREKQATGPALNVWASLEGMPRPSKQGMRVVVSSVINELGPAARQQGAAMRVGGSAGSSSSTDVTVLATTSACSLLTLNPGLYSHRNPPLTTYGYSISGLPCARVASASAATSALEAAGARSFPTTYSVWLKPSVPAPPLSMSMEQQSCHLVVSVLNRSYTSTEKFPCSMLQMSPDDVGEGCCYNAGGSAPVAGSGRHLRSSWEKAVSNRRAMQH